MRLSLRICACLVATSFGTLPAMGGPISFYVGGNILNTKIDDTVNLADPTQGAKLTFESQLPGPSGDSSQTIDSTASIYLNSGAPLNSPALNLTIALKGTITHDPSNPTSDLDGGYTGTVVNVLPNHDWTVGDGVPAWLVDLAAHPERIHLTGVVTGGSQNLLESTLTIDPPTVVPEPSTLAIVLVAAVGWLLPISKRRGEMKRRPR